MIRCNNFVHRQTSNSPFAHYDGSWADLEALAEQYFHSKRAGDNGPGSLLIEVPPKGFFTSLVPVHPETELVAKVVRRRPEEDSYIQITARASKRPAVAVDLVLYSHELLGVDASTADNWEIVSINARPFHAPDPMAPVTMARNFFGLPGGTKANYTAEEFARAILFWNNYALVDPNP